MLKWNWRKDIDAEKHKKGEFGKPSLWMYVDDPERIYDRLAICFIFETEYDALVVMKRIRVLYAVEPENRDE